MAHEMWLAGENVFSKWNKWLLLFNTTVTRGSVIDIQSINVTIDISIPVCISYVVAFLAFSTWLSVWLVAALMTAKPHPPSLASLIYGLNG